MILVDPGNPDTRSFALRRVDDGSPIDPETEMLTACTYFERVDLPDPDPQHAAKLAQQRFDELAGAVATMTVSCVPQPWLEPGQIIAVEYNGMSVYAQVAGWSMNIGDRAEMVVQLRAWRVTSQIGMPMYAPVPPDEMSVNRATPIGLDTAADSHAGTLLDSKPSPSGAYSAEFDAPVFDTATGQAP